MTQVEKHTKSTYRVIRNTLVLSVCEFHGTQGFYVGAVELVPCVPSIGTQEKELAVAKHDCSAARGTWIAMYVQ